MKPVAKHINLTVLQCAAWVFVFLILFVSLLQYDPWVQAAVNATLFTSVYLLVMYTNAAWLIPRFYQQKRYWLYGLLALALLIFATLYRIFVPLSIYNAWFAKKPEPFRASLLLPSFFSIVLVFIVSIMFSLALNYFRLSRVQQQIKGEKAAAELELLKQQMQPHFLFNTLNNIYYVAQKESPATAELIERLSAIMRYFTEESPREQVPLKNEIELLRNYMELENIRMLNRVQINFTIAGVTDTATIPPLLLLPVVENIFKHGIDKKSEANTISISITQKAGHLYFSTHNKPYQQQANQYTGGKGLANLQRQLQVYYGSNYSFTAGMEGALFTVYMKIPVHEH